MQRIESVILSFHMTLVLKPINIKCQLPENSRDILDHTFPWFFKNFFLNVCCMCESVFMLSDMNMY